MKTLDIQLTDQVALVTGGGAGIGRGAALALAELGADVALVEIDPDRAEQTARDVRELGRMALVLPTDVMDTDQIRTAVARTDQEFGRIDILVNNAGGVRGRRFLEQSERSWRRHIDINLVSMLATTHAVAPIMIREGRGGSIVNVASIEAFRAAPMYAVYAACKAGMASFSRTMALELGEHGIRVNGIAPDHTDTPGTRGQRAGADDPSQTREAMAEERAAWERLIPLGRTGSTDECGSAVAFLCTRMAAYVTGVTLPVDGGTWASSGWIRSVHGGWTLNEPLRSDE